MDHSRLTTAASDVVNKQLAALPTVEAESPLISAAEAMEAFGEQFLPVVQHMEVHRAVPVRGRADGTKQPL